MFLFAPLARTQSERRRRLALATGFRLLRLSGVLHGDGAAETFLSEIVGAPAYPARHMSMESIYEYGSRAGVWRILREFERRGLPLTVFGVAMALERNPEVTAAFVALSHEIACHGWRWISYQSASRSSRPSTCAPAPRSSAA